MADSVRVSFKNGNTIEGDVLVGADGLYSRVRTYLQGQDRLEPPVYSGTCCWRWYFDGSGLPLDDRYSWAEYFGQGGCMAIEEAFELAKQLATIASLESVSSLLRQFESSRCDFRSERLRQRINRVFTISRQVVGSDR